MSSLQTHTTQYNSTSVLAFKDTFCYINQSQRTQLYEYQANISVLASKGIHCSPSIISSHYATVNHQKDFKVPEEKETNVQITVNSVIWIDH